MKKTFKVILIFSLCSSIFFNIHLIKIVSSYRSDIDRAIEYSHWGVMDNIEVIIKDLNESLIDIEQSKLLEDRKYVIDALEEAYKRLSSNESILRSLMRINNNYDIDIDPLTDYIYELKDTVKTSNEGLTDIDKKTLKEITDIRFYNFYSNFYEESSIYGVRKPQKLKEEVKKPFKILEKICDDAILELYQRN